MQQQQDATFFADLLMPFCEAASINLRRPEEALIKRILVSFSFVKNIQQLHQTLFPDHHMDWKGVEAYLEEVHYSTADWIRLIDLIDFPHEVYAPSQQVTEIITSTLAGMKTPSTKVDPLDSLRICFAKSGISITWDTLCKAFILLNLTDIDNVAVLDYVLAKLPAQQQSRDVILRHLPGVFRHDPQEYLDIFANILRSKETCHIRSHYIQQSIHAREEAQEKKRTASQSVLFQHKKPSLTKIIEAQQQQEAQSSAHCDSFYAFCTSTRLPTNASARIKRVIYFAKCLESMQDPQIYIPKIVGNDPHLVEKIVQYDVVTPDMTALKQFLAETHYHGEPFTGLKQFRQACLPVGKATTHWSTVFRLYLCVFCKAALVKDLWLHVWNQSHAPSSLIPNSNETQLAIQKYLSENKINMDDSLRVLLEN